MAFGIQKELGLPILFAGLGEKPEDLQPFDRESFVDGILSGN
jgi:fused signal recognition particle receptor